MLARMKKLVEELSRASEAYYKYDKPIMTDKAYDKLYDELEELEQKTGIIFANSPTQKVQGQILVSLTKVTHSKPMLSSKKTKSTEELFKFVMDQPIMVSWKLDGLTIVLKYQNGTLQQAITRGNGEEGEDVNTYTITPTVENLSPNYTYTVETGTLEIIPRSITISAEDVQKVYDGEAAEAGIWLVESDQPLRYAKVQLAVFPDHGEYDL